MDDSELARDFSAGSGDAFDSVYTSFRGPVFGIALHVLADPGLAEEAVQTTFIGLWRSRARFDPSRSLTAWVFGIARKAAIDIYRRERRLPPIALQGPEPTVEGLSVERMWEVWEVRRAVDGLPADEAQVMRLAHYYQFTHNEIADRLGIPVGTVKSRSFRAHRRLAVALNHLFDNSTDQRTAGPPNNEVPAGRPGGKL